MLRITKVKQLEQKRAMRNFVLLWSRSDRGRERERERGRETFFDLEPYAPVSFDIGVTEIPQI